MSYLASLPAEHCPDFPGRGGNGCASTAPAIKGTLFGRPDGGDGGRGGCVFLEATSALQGFRGVRFSMLGTGECAGWAWAFCFVGRECFSLGH